MLTVQDDPGQVECADSFLPPRPNSDRELDNFAARSSALFTSHTAEIGDPPRVVREIEPDASPNAVALDFGFPRASPAFESHRCCCTDLHAGSLMYLSNLE